MRHIPVFVTILVGCAGAAPSPAKTPSTPSGLPALHRAAALGQADEVRQLLTDGADPNALESDMGLSALHNAAYSGSIPTARALLDAGAIIDLQSPSIGDTPLHDAVAFRNGRPPELIRFLLERGASVAIRNHPGLTPLELARAIKDDEVIAILEAEEKRRQSPALIELMAAIRSDDRPAAERVLAADASIVDQRDDQGFAPLSRAARTGRDEMVGLLLDAGAKPNQLDRWMGATAGHKAAFWGHAAVVSRLVAAGLDVDAQGKYNGYTALADAVSQGHLEVATVLVEAGARTDIVAHDGTTALSIAEARGEERMLQLLRR